MHVSKMRGVRLLAAGLLLAALVAALTFPVSGADPTTKATVTSATTVPSPLDTTASSHTTTVATTKVTPSPTTKTTTAPVTTRAPTTAPTTAKTTTRLTTAPTTTAPTSAPTTRATTAPTYQAPSLPPASTVVSAPVVVGGPYTVPAGTGIFTVTSVGNVPVGGSGVVQLLVDNGWQPLFGDTYVDVTWDPAMVAYESAAIKVLNTTAAVSSDHSVRIMLGDFRRGYPQGRYPLASITLRALRDGTSTLGVSVDHVRFWNDDFSEFTDITATASGRSGTFSTGPLPAETQPLVTFTQNTLPASYYTAVTDESTEAPTTATTAPTTTASTVSTTEAPPAATPYVEMATETPPTPTPNANGTYSMVSTRVKTSGFPIATVAVASLAVVGAAALLARRRRG